MARAAAVLVWLMWVFPSDPGGTGLDTLQRLTKPQTGILPTDEIAASLFRQGTRRSATLLNLAAEIEASDVRVLALVVDEPGPWRGFTRFIAAADGVRILSVAVNPRLHQVEQLAALAHELQHVCEIARARDVVDQAGMRRLFAKLGYQTQGHHYETLAAQTVERQVRLEVARNR
jgi:hypothetical protein